MSLKIDNQLNTLVDQKNFVIPATAISSIPISPISYTTVASSNDNVGPVGYYVNDDLMLYCIIGYVCTDTENINRYSFDLKKYQYYMIGKLLHDGVDLIELNEELITYLQETTLEDEFPIIQIVSKNESNKFKNKIEELPQVMLNPKVFYGIKSSESTSTINQLESRYSSLPF